MNVDSAGETVENNSTAVVVGGDLFILHSPSISLDRQKWPGWQEMRTFDGLGGRTKTKPDVYFVPPDHMLRYWFEKNSFDDMKLADRLEAAMDLKITTLDMCTLYAKFHEAGILRSVRYLGHWNYLLNKREKNTNDLLGELCMHTVRELKQAKRTKTESTDK